MTIQVPNVTDTHEFAVQFMRSVETQLKPYNHTPNLLISNLWALILDACAGIEAYGVTPDKVIQDLYQQHDIMPLREGYLEKWWGYHLKSGLLRSQGRWWLSTDPRNLKFTADATDLMEQRYRAAWRLYTAEVLHQKSPTFSLDPWQKQLGNIQDQSTAADIERLKAELFC